MKIIAHRGYSARYVENSSEAFQSAIELGVRAIECDVQEVDGNYYIFHDRNVKRLCGIDKDFDTLTHQEVADLRLSNNQTILDLAQLFEIVQNKASINLELKAVSNVNNFQQQVSQAISRFGTDIIISAFSHPLLVETRNAFRGSRNYESIKYGALVAHLPNDLATYAHRLDVDICAIDARMVNEAFVKHAHDHALEVWCYTVNDQRLYDRLSNIEVDAVFTDRVEWGLNQKAK